MSPLRTTRRGFLRLSGSAGLGALAGLPALPVRGEEIRPGCYVSRMTLEGKSLHPEEAIRYILSSDANIQSAGARGSIFEVASRLYNHRRSDRIARS